MGGHDMAIGVACSGHESHFYFRVEFHKCTHLSFRPAHVSRPVMSFATAGGTSVFTQADPNWSYLTLFLFQLLLQRLGQKTL